MALYALTGHVAAGYGNLYLHLPIALDAIGRCKLDIGKVLP